MRSSRSLVLPLVASAALASASPALDRPTPQEIRDATPHRLRDVAALLAARALPANAPNGYTPQVNACPSSKPMVRQASNLSDEETAWLQKRRQATVEPMRTLLGRLNITGLDTDQYIDNHSSNFSALPNIGIAASGGGYRAMLNGAGHIEAWDSRTPGSTSGGQLGGLLQSTTYLAGLSGGSWLVGSLYTNNFTSINEILALDTDSNNSGDLWQFGNSIFEGPEKSGIQLLGSIDYYKDLLDQVHGKKNAGFDVTITDYWGRALSYQLVNATNGGPAFTWSSIAEQDWFTDGSVPLPLLVADGRAPGETLVSSNTTIYTFDPWEFGTFDPTVYGFVPMKYVGTNFTMGEPTTANECVTGFDNVGYVMGTSSTLFNAALSTINGSQTTGLLSSALQQALEDILTDVGKANNDIADYPNPFYKYNPTGKNKYATSQSLTLVDGGEDLQNIPLHPLIQPVRHVDVIFAIDSSADTNTTYPTTHSASGWPDGASLVATYERSKNSIENGTVFPSIPDINTFMNLGLNNRPTFFGCDVANLTGPAPLIVYLPNAPYVYTSNTSTYDMQYNDTERNAMVLNAYNGATQGNGTLDGGHWGTCVGCAILSRSLHRTNTPIPDVCTQCFEHYCWNGTIDSSQPADYVPAMKIPDLAIKVSGAVQGATFSMLASVGIAAFAVFANL
ncbi:Hypothetical protein R9X50_00551700 [Acrodontium crateriforme]|uniref:Lysophospholipase n=1 Tax=Acrodontium crateriforme TaxID=150365 RepID=A0AAQ3M6A4_9PEZI|nr:Hypothetical protein R9X50_00551700 [Acrodontium crateriforme]